VTGHARHSSFHHNAPGSNLPNSDCALLFVGVREVRSPNVMSQQYGNISCMRRQSTGRWKEGLVQRWRRWWVSLWREYAEPYAIALYLWLKTQGGTSLQSAAGRGCTLNPGYWTGREIVRPAVGRDLVSTDVETDFGLRCGLAIAWDLFQNPVQYDGPDCCGERSQLLRRDLPPLIRAFISTVTRWVECEVVNYRFIPSGDTFLRGS
jgi:hypothetical protein